MQTEISRGRKINKKIFTSSNAIIWDLLKIREYTLFTQIWVA